MYLFTPYLYLCMSLSPSDVPGYKRRKGFCFGQKLTRDVTYDLTAQQCANECNAKKKCKAFLYDITNSRKCALKTRVCKNPDTSIRREGYMYERCKSVEADVMLYIFFAVRTILST